MLIRSQNKKTLLNLDQVIALTSLSCYKGIKICTINYYQTVTTDGDGLGVYSSEKNAQKALDMLSLAYRTGNRVFDMPKDEDIPEGPVEPRYGMIEMREV